MIFLGWFFCACAQKKNNKIKSEEKIMMKTLPALVYVAAGDGIRCVKAPHVIDFNYFNAASVVVERFCFLREKKI